MEQRRFHRVECDQPASLTLGGLNYPVTVRNLSLRGALLSSDECFLAAVDEICSLTLSFAEGLAPATISVKVVHSFFSMSGVKFVGFAEGAEEHLLEFLRSVTREPEKLAAEWRVLHPAEPASMIQAI
ncbi:PilZ domain-containing protein [Geomonas sp. Red32]|uniref:PilZ domain-containing protein n=1 Tax=Geomonas sp. Red32 TaxID=2912856 RepID=UPI00202CED19|nr:PilZ domain-containing protein [Geomonas sp. Red32]MCM0084268.1 PilZ domain-containing protein [Geomonas sp. Red32]